MLLVKLEVGAQLWIAIKLIPQKKELRFLRADYVGIFCQRMIEFGDVSGTDKEKSGWALRRFMNKIYG